MLAASLYNIIPNCPICHLTYSQSVLPMNLPDCGHNICNNCLNTIKRQNELKSCPECKTKFSKTEIKKNFALIQVIENLQPKNLAAIHMNLIEKMPNYLFP